MKIRLGYACLPVTIDITSSRTITYTNYKKLKEKANIKLNEIIISNFKSLEQILKYNIQNNIKFFRMTSNLIPLATHKDVNYEIFNRYKNYFKKIGKIIKKNNLRIDMHMDPYCVINSDKKEVVNNSINILKFSYKILNSMNIKPILILHIGSSKNGKEMAIKRFIDNFNKLPNYLKKAIVIENDDKIYNILDTLNLCETLKIPMVLDYHHHLCNKVCDISIYIERILNTWNYDIPKLHFSSPKKKKEFRSHNDYIDYKKFISFLEIVKRTNRDIDIMIEAKKKDEALFSLIRALKYKNIYKIKKNEIFIN